MRNHRDRFGCLACRADDLKHAEVDDIDSEVLFSWHLRCPPFRCAIDNVGSTLLLHWPTWICNAAHVRSVRRVSGE